MAAVSTANEEEEGRVGYPLQGGEKLLREYVVENLREFVEIWNTKDTEQAHSGGGMAIARKHGSAFRPVCWAGV